MSNYRKEYEELEKQIKVRKNCVILDNELEEAIRKIINTNKNSENYNSEEKALVSKIWECFHVLVGREKNQYNFYEKTKFFKFEEKIYQIFLRLIKGKITYGIEQIKECDDEELLNEIIKEK